MHANPILLYMHTKLDNSKYKNDIKLRTGAIHTKPLLTLELICETISVTFHHFFTCVDALAIAIDMDLYNFCEVRSSSLLPC